MCLSLLLCATLADAAAADADAAAAAASSHEKPLIDVPAACMGRGMGFAIER